MKLASCCQFRVELSIALCTCVLLCVGCSDEFPLAPVSGTVVLNGEPLADARICLNPTAKREDGAAGQASHAITDSAGRFELMSVDGRKGAVVGSHRVVVSMFKADQSGKILRHETLPRRFNAATKLTFEVPAKGSEEAEIQLEANDLLRPPRSSQKYEIESIE